MSDPKRPRRGDWVRCASVPPGSIAQPGLVMRVSRVGGWADVKWRSGAVEWSKRMPCSSLVVLHAIQFPGGRNLRKMADATPKRGDWVRCGSMLPGIVRRVARDGAWADVKWRLGEGEWTKRMPCSALVVLIPFHGGTVTDMTREKELEG